MVDVRLDELRLAIFQTLGCDGAQLAEVVPVSLDLGDGSRETLNVHVFDIRHRATTCCYAWPSAVDRATIIIHAVLHAGSVASPEQAVRAAMRRKAPPKG